MATSLGDLVVKLSLDAAGFASDAGRAARAAEQFANNVKTKLGEAKNAASQFGSSLSSALGGIGSEFTEGLSRVSEVGRLVTETFKEMGGAGGVVVGVFGAVAVAAVAAAAAIAVIAISTSRQVKEMVEAAEAAGIETEAFNAMAIAAEQNGVTMERFSTSVNKFNQAVVDAGQGGDETAEAFARLGVELEDNEGNLKSTQQLVEESARAFGRLAPSQQRAKDEMLLFGRAGTALSSFFKNFDEDVKEAAESNAVFTRTLQAEAEEFDKATERAETQIQAFKNAIAVGALPILTALVEAFTDWVKALNSADGQMTTASASFITLKTAILAVALPITVLVDGFNVIGQAIGALIDTIKLLIVGAGAIGGAINAMFRFNVPDIKASLNELSTAVDEWAQKQQQRLMTPSLTATVLSGFDERVKAAQARASATATAPTDADDGSRRIEQTVAAQRQAAKAITDAAIRAAELRNREEARLLQERNQAASDANALIEISFNDFYARRLEAQRQFTERTVANLQSEIDATRRLLSAQTEAGKPLIKNEERIGLEQRVAELRAKQVEAQKAGAAAEQRISVEQTLSQRAFAKEVEATNIAVLELQGNLELATEKRFDLDNQDRVKRAALEANQAYSDQIALQRELVVQQARFNQALDDTEKIRADLGRTESHIAAQVQTGQLTSLEGEVAISEARKRTVALNEQEIEKLQRLGELTPAQTERLKDLVTENERLAASVDTLGQSLNAAFTGAAADAFVSFIEGTKSAKEAFADFAQSVVHTVNQMIAQALAEKLFKSVIGDAMGAGAGAGGIGGLLSSFFGGGVGAAVAGGAASAGSNVVFATAMADGGTFNPGQPILVGERGPELLRPNFAGQVIPNQRSGPTNNVSVVVNVPQTADRRSADQIGASVGIAVNRAIRRTQ